MMPESANRYTFDRVVRMVISAVILIGVLALLRHLADVLIPFAAALVLAYVLNPLVAAFEHRTGRRGLAVAMTIGGMGIVGVASIVILIPVVYSQIARFGRDLDRLRADVAASVQHSAPTQESKVRIEPVSPLDTGKLDPGEPGAFDAGDAASEQAGSTNLGLREIAEGWAAYRDPDSNLSRSQRLALFWKEVSGTQIGDALKRFTKSEEFTDFLLKAAKRIAAGGWSVVTFALNALLGLTALIIVVVYLVFLLLDYPEYARSWKSFLPPTYRETIVEFLHEFDGALRRYLRGQSVIAAATGVLYAVGFSIIGLPMAIPLGLGIGLLNMVPYLQSVGLVPALLLAVVRSIETNWSLTASIVSVLVVFGVVQVLQDWVIAPRIMGKATGLRPVLILLGVFVWGKLLGFLGLLLAIPLTCLGIAYYRRYVLKQTAQQTMNHVDAASADPAS